MLHSRESSTTGSGCATVVAESVNRYDPARRDFTKKQQVQRFFLEGLRVELME
jgi:hypothetical protein